MSATSVGAVVADLRTTTSIVFVGGPQVRAPNGHMVHVAEPDHNMVIGPLHNARPLPDTRLCVASEDRPAGYLDMHGRNGNYRIVEGVDYEANGFVLIGDTYVDPSNAKDVATQRRRTSSCQCVIL